MFSFVCPFCLNPLFSADLPCLLMRSWWIQTVFRIYEEINMCRFQVCGAMSADVPASPGGRPNQLSHLHTHTHTHTHTHANTHAHTPQLPHQRCERGKHLHLPYFQSRSLFVHLQPEISLLDTSVSCTFKRTTPWRPINPKPSLTLDNTWNTYWSDSVWLTLPEDIMISYFHPGKTSNNSQRNHWRNLIQNLFFMFFSFLEWESDPETVSLRLCAHC